MKAFILLAVAPEACEYRLFSSLSFSLTEGSQILWVTIRKDAILFFLLDCLLSVPFFTAWTSTQDGFLRVLFGDRADECSVSQPTGSSCGVNICHVPPSRSFNHFLVHLFPALHAILLYNLSQGSRTESPSGSGVSASYRRAHCCHTLPTNPLILFYRKFL